MSFYLPTLIVYQGHRRQHDVCRGGSTNPQRRERELSVRECAILTGVDQFSFCFCLCATRRRRWDPVQADLNLVRESIFLPILYYDVVNSVFLTFFLKSFFFLVDSVFLTFFYKLGCVVVSLVSCLLFFLKHFLQGFGSAFFLRIRIRAKIFIRIRILGVSGGGGWG